MLRGKTLLVLIACAGCASSRDVASAPRDDDPFVASRTVDSAAAATHEEDHQRSSIVRVSDTNPALTPPLLKHDEDDPSRLSPVALELALAYDDEIETEQIVLDDVIGSVYRSFPLLEAALYGRNIASGEQLSASGAFDLKFKAASENGPTGFYQTYRQSVGVIQPLFDGGEVFAGYRVGRGDFEPWYQERQTNDGGEFKAGVLVPLARDRDIDERRAGVWRTALGRQLAEPEINAQLIGFIQEASYAYWGWVAAAEKYRIAERVLQLAVDRTDRIRRQVELELLDPPELTDNLRLVAERRGKLAEARRKLQHSAIKLSLYYRDYNGEPVVPDERLVAEFPVLTPLPNEPAEDARVALAQRPELSVYQFLRRQLEIDYRQAQNELRPSVNMVLATSQDVGEPTSSKNDKGQFEFDASIFVDVPLQRRKAQGKVVALQAKLSQLTFKQEMTENKIVAEVQTAYAALEAAIEQALQAERAVEFAEDLAQRERRNFEEGISDLLKVTLREQYAVEAAEKEVDALLQYFQARADYRAALAQDQAP